MVEEALSHVAVPAQAPAGRSTDYFGELVFGRNVMRRYLDRETYEALIQTMEHGTPLTREVADGIAAGMKQWAVEHGADHYTHWFQPLTGGTAEKHDSFAEPDGRGGVLEEFSGKLLVQQEPDASSFPNGGIRNTFEARGYSAWDPASPAFIVGSTLCIPTVFIAYTGEALDYKTPLLRSLAAVDRAATEVCRYFDRNVSKVFSYLGWEQEYFLVDEALWAARPDLVLTGRTLMGHESAKNQQLEDHYFGAIPERVIEFMRDLEYESLRLGIPVKTRHNEVAPNQFELAPIYEEANLANDHNQLLMTIMNKIARRHNFRILLHEKPFKGVNGSGKHNNWSLGTDTGVNLLGPGKTPSENLQFITFLVNVMAAVYRHNGLLKASIMSATNAHRLGANEAPPAIISTFLGAQISAVLEKLEASRSDAAITFSAKNMFKMSGISHIPTLMLDNTDRNRTSPFAFTGNKFEFRMPGSGVNLSDCNMILNTAMAKSLKDFADAMEGKAGEEFEAAAIDYIRDVLTAHQRIIFNGNGYSEEWTREAERRGLANHPTTADALPCFVEPKSIALFEEFGVLTETEVRSRYEVKLEKYNKLLNIEARTMKRMVRRAYLPAINSYAAEVAGHINAIRSACAGADTDQQEELLRRLLLGIKEIDTQLRALGKLHHETLEIESEQEKANTYAHEVIPVMDRLRTAVDGLEVLVDRDHWPVPTYNDILFYV